MPYQRKYTKYKKRYKRRTSYRKPASSGYLGYAGTAINTASKALAVAYGIKKLLNVEFKFFDTQLTATAIPVIPVITQLTNIPQGDTDQTRDGAQVKLTRLDIKMVVNSHASAVSTEFRVMVVLDKQTNQAIYNATDLLSDVTAGDSIVSALNLDNKYRFRVLYNKVMSFSNVGHNSQYTQISIPLDLRLRFDASTPSIADLTSNSLSMLFTSSQATNTPNLSLFARIRYVDN